MEKKRDLTFLHSKFCILHSCAPSTCKSAVAAFEECPITGSCHLPSSAFTPHDGRKYSLSTMRRHLATAKRLAGIERRLRIHDLSQSAACKMISAGVPLMVVSKVLGHSSTAITEKVYARLDQAAFQQVAAAMERQVLNLK